MMHRVTMRDGTVWFLDEDHDDQPVRMTNCTNPRELPFEQWNHTPHSYVGSGSDLTRLAMDIAKWAEMDEYLVAEIVALAPEVMPRVPRYEASGMMGTMRGQLSTMDPNIRNKINQEMITIRKAMRRIEKLMENL